MGICSSTKRVSSVKRDRVVESHANTFKTLDIGKSEARQLYTVFATIDDDDSGEVSLMEFLTHFDLERTAFSKRCFTMFDTDKSAQIDFREFVLATYCFCSYDKAALTRFAFDLYDLDGSGELDLDEVEALVRSVYGKGFETNIYARRILQRMKKEVSDSSELVAVTKNEFVAFCARHPALIFPAFQMQGVLREKILGNRFWDKAVVVRSKTFDTEAYQDFVEYMSQAKFEEMVEATFEPERYTSPTPHNDKGNEFVRLKFAEEEARRRGSAGSAGAGAGSTTAGTSRRAATQQHQARGYLKRAHSMQPSNLSAPAAANVVKILKGNTNAKLHVATAKAQRATVVRNNYLQHQGRGAVRRGHAQLRKSQSSKNL